MLGGVTGSADCESGFAWNREEGRSTFIFGSVLTGCNRMGRRAAGLQLRRAQATVGRGKAAPQRGQYVIPDC